MLKSRGIEIAAIRGPVKRAKTLDEDRVAELAVSILELGLPTPIQVRADGRRFVLIEGLHCLEAMKALGESIIDAYLVQARQH